MDLCWYKVCYSDGCLLLSRAYNADAFSGTHPLLLRCQKREKHIAYERAQNLGWRKFCPASHHCHIPACWVFLVSSTGWETSLPWRDSIIPDVQMTPLFSFLCLCFCHVAKTFMQSKVVINVT